MKVAPFPKGSPITDYAASIDAALAGRALLKVRTLAEIADCSVDHLDLEAKRGNVELVGSGRRRRIPVESARRWLLRLHEELPAAARRVAAAGGGPP